MMLLKMAYRYTLVTLLLILSGQIVYASHLAGGHFTYKYLGLNTNGREVYRITLTLIQDCKNGDPKVIDNDNPAHFTFFRKSNNTYLSNHTVYATRTGVPIPLGVNPDCFDNLPEICLQEAIFSFDFELPKPNEANYDPNGYIVAYQRCCRNRILTNVIQPFKVGTTIFSNIPATGVQNNSPMPPEPPLVICLNAPQRISYRNSDPDGDSLSYQLCTSYVGASEDNSNPLTASNPPYTALSYRSPFSYTQPVPSTVPVYLDPITGMLEFEPDIAGVYTIVVCIDEYRNGVKIADHRQETQFYISPCSQLSYARLPVLADNPKVHQIVCDGYTVNFGNTSQGAQDYLWDFGDPTTTTDVSTDRYPTYTYPDTGVYKVKLYTDLASSCPDSTEKEVRIYPYFLVDFSVQGILCAGQPITFTDLTQSTFGDIIERDWRFGDGQFGKDSIEVHSYANSTQDYQIVLSASNSFGCRDTALKAISVLGTQVHAGGDTIVLNNVDVQLGATAESSVKWRPATFMDNDTLIDPTFNFPTVGVYQYVLESTNELGCIGRDTVTITVTDKEYFFVPNAFTPNGDGLNDIVKITSVGLSKLMGFKIFNRYGEQIFSTLDIKTGWDGMYKGKALPIGTYFWIGEGINYRGDRVINKGDITLLK